MNIAYCFVGYDIILFQFSFNFFIFFCVFAYHLILWPMWVHRAKHQKLHDFFCCLVYGAMNLNLAHLIAIFRLTTCTFSQINISKTCYTFFFLTFHSLSHDPMEIHIIKKPCICICILYIHQVRWFLFFSFFSFPFVVTVVVVVIIAFCCLGAPSFPLIAVLSRYSVNSFSAALFSLSYFLFSFSYSSIFGCSFAILPIYTQELCMCAVFELVLFVQIREIVGGAPNIQLCLLLYSFILDLLSRYYLCICCNNARCENHL